MLRFRRYALLTVLVLSACGLRSSGLASAQAQYLYLWTASDEATQPDFLAVLDVTEDGSRYGRLVATLPVPGRGNRPHHTEHEMPAGFRGQQTWPHGGAAKGIPHGAVFSRPSR